jgi:hypothetical protein
LTAAGSTAAVTNVIGVKSLAGLVHSNANSIAKVAMSPIVIKLICGYSVFALALLMVVLPMCRDAARGDRQLRGE